jgi:hypothetical protein
MVVSVTSATLKTSPPRKAEGVVQDITVLNDVKLVHLWVGDETIELLSKLNEVQEFLAGLFDIKVDFEQIFIIDKINRKVYAV